MTNLQYPHVAARLFNTPLLIEEGKLRAIAHGLSQRFGVELHGLPPAPHMLREERSKEPTPPYRIVNGRGIIPVFHTLVHRSGRMDAMSGLTSYEQIGTAFDAALTDNAVESIVLHIDSPGGEAQGVFDLADKILQAQTDKPVIAFADNATSAAYLLGSAVDQFFVSQSAPTGSIGVRLLHVDQSQMEAAAGLVVTEIFAGARKADGTPHAPLNPESLAAIQARVNDFYDLFVEAVARNRGLSASTIRSTEAGIFIGAKALPLGLVDGVRTLDHLVALPGRGTAAAVPQITTKSERRDESMEQLESVAALVAAYPDMAAQLRTDAVTAERARIKEILTLAPRGCEQLAQTLAFEESCTPGDAAMRFLTAQKTATASQLAGFTAEAPPPVDPVSSTTQDAAVAKTEGEQLMEEAAERRNQERRARRGQLSSVQGGRR